MKYFLVILFSLLVCSQAEAQTSLLGKVLRFVPTSLPSTCGDGDVRTNTSDNKLYFCLSDTWYLLIGGSTALTASEVVVTDGSGNLTTETTLAKVRGGTGADNSSVTFPSTGVLVTEAGTATLINKALDADGTGNSITNIENADIKVGAAIDATKIADGSVSSTEFQYIGTLTSDAQTQLDAKIDDFSGTTDNVLLRTDGTGGNSIQESGITVDDSNNMTGINYLDISEIAAPGSPAADALRIYVEDQNGITDLLTVDSGGFETRLGEDLTIIVRNETGAQIDLGDVVYFNGSNGTRPTVALAQADAIATARAAGIAAESIADNGFGRIITRGVLRGVDTSAFTAGDTLYLSSTVAGALQNTAPAHPSFQQVVGEVIFSDPSTGIIEVETLGLDGNEQGTTQNNFSIGDATAGAKTLSFKNANTGVLSWNPTGSQTLTLPAATDTLVGKSTTDDLSNKTFVDAITVEGLTATPSNPASGDLKLYAKNDDKVYKLTSAGVESEIGAGGGGSGINYFSDFQADTISNVAEFDDTSAILDGTGGGAIADLDATLESSVQLSGDNSYKLSKSGSSDQQYAGWSIDTDTPDRTSVVGGETVYITFNYETSANFAKGDVGIYVYRVGSNTLEACNARDILSGTFTNELPKADDVGQFQCKATLESSDTSIRLIFGIIDSTTTNWDLYVDKIKIGPDSIVTAPIVSEMQSCSVTVSWGTSSSGCYYKRVGDHMLWQFFAQLDGTGLSGGLTVSIPNGLNLDTTKVVSATGPFNNFGYAYLQDAGTSANRVGAHVRWDGSSTTTVDFQAENSSTVTTTAPFTWANTDSFRFTAMIPISEWANSNAILSTTQADQSTFKARLIASGGSQTVSAGATSEIDFGAIDYDTHGSASVADNSIIIPKSGYYYVGAGVALETAGTGEDRYTLLIRGDAASILSGYSTVSADGTSGPSVSDILYLEKDLEITLDIQNGDNVSHNVSQNGFVTFLTVVAQPDFSTFSTYGVYERGFAESSAFDLSTAGYATSEFAQMTGNSISLRPGTHILRGFVYHSSTAPGSSQAIRALWATANGDNTTSTPSQSGATIENTDVLFLANVNSSGGDIQTQLYEMAETEVTVTTTTSIYLVPSVYFTTASTENVIVYIYSERAK